MRPMRRRKGRDQLALLLLTAALGCSRHDVPPGDGGTVNPDSASVADAATAGDGSTVANPDGAPAAASLIKHVIVIVKENHTFDNYFGSFPGAEGITTCPLPGGPGPCPKASYSTRDLCHAHDCALTDWNQGKMDGWGQVTSSTVAGDNLAWAQHDGSTIPNYWSYAKNFTLADHFFANELGPSFPGHTFVLAAQAGWATGNPGTNILKPYWGCDQGASTTVTVLDNGTCATKDVFPCFQIPSLPDVLPGTASWK